MRVLVTRPEPVASRTAAELAARGFEPVLLPLTRIEPLDSQEIDATPFEALAVTSANALRHATPPLLAAIRHLRCFAVGGVTAKASRDLGFVEVETGDGDATGLAGIIVGATKPSAKILYLCGRLRRPVFENELAGAGISVTALETYETLSIDYAADQLTAHLGAEPIDLVLVYSAESAIALLRLIKSVVSPVLPRRALCISSRVAAVLSAEGLETIVASEPTEASMLSALRDISSAEP